MLGKLGLLFVLFATANSQYCRSAPQQVLVPAYGCGCSPPILPAPCPCSAPAPCAVPVVPQYACGPNIFEVALGAPNCGCNGLAINPPCACNAPVLAAPCGCNQVLAPACGRQIVPELLINHRIANSAAPAPPCCCAPELPLPILPNACTNPFLPAASPVSAFAPQIVSPLLPPVSPYENRNIYLRKIPIPPPCI